VAREEPLRLLITSSGSTASQNLMEALRRGPEVMVVGADVRSVHGGLGCADVEVQVPPGGEAGYVAELAALVREHRIDLVIPVMEAELLAVSSARAMLEEAGTKVLVSSPTAIQTCASKRKLAETFSDLGIPTARVIPPGEKASFPLFARPDSVSGSRGAVYIESEERLAVELKRRPDLVVTEFVDGPEFSIDAFSAPGGRITHAICRQREEVKGGLAVRSVVVPIGARREIVERLGRHLGLFGFFNLQFRSHPGGDDYFFDLNPRLGGAMALSFAAGLDAPLLIRAVIDDDWDLPPMSTAIGMRLVRRWRNVILPPPGGGPEEGPS
jgi:carbamoyl-phosphate synthase large subunit